MSKKPTGKNQPGEPVRAASDQELLFVYAGKNQDAAGISKHIAGALLRARSEASLLLVSPEADALRSQPDVAALIEKNKCVVASGFEEAREMLATRSGLVYVIDTPESFNPAAVSHCFGTNRRAFGDAAAYAGYFDKQSGKPAGGFGARLALGVYNFFASLLLPAGACDYTQRFYFFSTATAAAHFNALNNTSLKLLCRVAYSEKETALFALTPREQQYRRSSWGAAIGTAFSARINWFVSEPLRYFKREDEAKAQPLYRLLFFAFFIFALFAMPYLSQDFGITWDAKRHNQYGYQMLTYFTSMGNDTTCLAPNSPIQEFRYYGEHFNVIAAFFNTYVKILGEFETRHLLNSLYGLLAMLFAALCAKEIGSWRSGFFAFVFVFCSPVFFAHSMNNPTDIPFAAGSTIALYYLLKILKRLPAPSPAHIVICGLGIGMAVGARVGGIIWYAYAGLFLGISWLLIAKKEGTAKAMKMIWPYAKIFILLVFVGHIASLSLWPFAQQKPFTNWYVALKQSTEGAYFTYNHELFEGVRMYMANVPWYYLPKFIFINTPLMVIAGILLVLAMSFRWRHSFERWHLMLVVVFVAVFPIAYAEAQSMYYYNGWRHYLFVYPPLVVLAALGWESLLRTSGSKALQYGIAGAAMAFTLLPVGWMIKNHPNECVYFNEIEGGTKAAYGNYELDYYSNSCRAAAEWLVKQEPDKKVVVAINNEPLTGAYYANKVNPNMEFRWVREYEEQRPDWDYAIFTSRTYSSHELLNGSFPPKGTVYTVEADGAPIAVVVKREDHSMPHGYAAFEARNFDSAVYYFTEAVRWNPKDEEAYRMLGQTYLYKGDSANALLNFGKAIELYPENYTAYSNIGMVYMNLEHNYSKAIDNFKKANAYKFNYTDAYYYTAACLYSQGDYMGGIKVLEDAVKRGGNGVPEIYYNLALGYYNTNNDKKAEENAIYALSLNPNMAAGFKVLGAVYTRMGRTAEAQQCMARYQQLGGS